jgi:hypothetical protein
VTQRELKKAIRLVQKILIRDFKLFLIWQLLIEAGCLFLKCEEAKVVEMITFAFSAIFVNACQKV